MDIQNKLEELDKRVAIIERRNKRVELNKEWEMSIARKISIAVLTYLVMVTFFQIIKISDPWINAIVPTLGFLLSTLSLGVIKNTWMNKKH